MKLRLPGCDLWPAKRDREGIGLAIMVDGKARGDRREYKRRPGLGQDLWVIQKRPPLAEEEPT